VLRSRRVKVEFFRVGGVLLPLSLATSFQTLRFLHSRLGPLGAGPLGAFCCRPGRPFHLFGIPQSVARLFVPPRSAPDWRPKAPSSLPPPPLPTPYTSDLFFRLRVCFWTLTSDIIRLFPCQSPPHVFRFLSRPEQVLRRHSFDLATEPGRLPPICFYKSSRDPLDVGRSKAPRPSDPPMVDDLLGQFLFLCWISHLRTFPPPFSRR